MRKVLLGMLCLLVLATPSEARKKKHHHKHFGGGDIASWYGGRFIGRKTACGTRFGSGLTAASLALPCFARARVTNKDNGRSVLVLITDKGPYVGGRIIDLSPLAKTLLRMGGLAHVRVERIK